MQNKKQSNDLNMKKSVCKDKCPACGGTGMEMMQLMDLHELYRDKYQSEVEKCELVYGSKDKEIQPYPIPCRRCNGGHAQKVKEVRSRANIPTSFYDKKIEDFDRTIYTRSDGTPVDISKAMHAVDSFIEDFSKWDTEGMGLYICSSMKGSGKTFLASCICNSVMNKHPVTTRFVSAVELLDLSKNSDGSGNYETDPISLLCNCKLLVIDDIGQKSCGSDWMNDVLFQIIDARYQKKLVTIYTSNAKVSHLELRDAIVDRVNARTLQISLPECSVRTKEANDIKRKFLTDMGIL